MHRREFLTVSAASAALAAVGGSGNATAALPAAKSGAEFSRTRFRSWLNEEFRLTASDSLRGSRAILIAVEDGPAHAGLDQFSVVFRGGASLPRGLTWLARSDGTQFLLDLNGATAGTLRRAHFSLLETQHG